MATSGAHDSGLCARDRAARGGVAADLLNLTLAAPRLNGQKSDKDAAEWLLARNQCWFAATVVTVRRAYGLTIDRREADVLEGIQPVRDHEQTLLIGSLNQGAGST